MNLVKEIINSSITGILAVFAVLLVIYLAPVYIFAKLTSGKVPMKKDKQDIFKMLVYSTIVWIVLIVLGRMNFFFGNY